MPIADRSKPTEGAECPTGALMTDAAAQDELKEEGCAFELPIIKSDGRMKAGRRSLHDFPFRTRRMQTGEFGTSWPVACYAGHWRGGAASVR